MVRGSGCWFGFSGWVEIFLPVALVEEEDVVTAFPDVCAQGGEGHGVGEFLVIMVSPSCLIYTDEIMVVE